MVDQGELSYLPWEVIMYLYISIYFILFCLENYFLKTNSKFTLIFITFLGISWMVDMCGDFCLYRMRAYPGHMREETIPSSPDGNGHPLWRKIGMWGEAWSCPHLVPVVSAHNLWSQYISLFPEFPGPSSSITSLSRSPGRRSEHQRKTRCSLLNLRNSH